MLSFESKPLIQRKTALALASISSKYSTGPTHQSKSSLRRHSSNSPSLASFVAAMESSRWPARRLEHVVKTVFQILEAHGAKMIREELRNAIREHVGDTGLIDFVLKHINNVVLGNQVIIRASKTRSKLLEFSLVDASEVAKKSETEPELELDTEIPALQPGVNVYKDLLLLYKKVLLGYPEYHAVSMAVGTILDSKHFVKKWELKSNTVDSSLRLTYQVRPSYNELVNELTQPLPPGEPVVIPESATIGELKLMLQYALRDTYCLMDQFVVKDIQIGELLVGDQQDLQKGGVKQDMEIWVRGNGLNMDTKLRYQGGDNDWTVDCKCRAKDDDGERMVACDVCHVWQHTRCNGIKDNDAPPPLFLCRLCSNRINKSAKSNSSKLL